MPHTPRRLFLVAIVFVIYALTCSAAQKTGSSQAEQARNWKTFSNRAGWSIRYPPDWTISSCRNCSDPTAPDVFVSFFPAQQADGTVMIEHLASKPKTADTDSWVADVKRTANLNPIVNEEKLSLNGLPALKVRYRTASGTEMQEVYVVSGTSTFSIAFSGDKPGTNVLENFKNYPIYLRMVATFKFS
jgi:photosystem II reaction center protein PsbP